MKRSMGKQALLLPLLLALAAGESRGQGVAAITKPSEDVKLSFVRAGRIASVLVKEGSEVAVGKLLMLQDANAEYVQLAQLKAQADDDIRVKAAAAQLAQKQTDLKRYQKLFQDKAASELEVEHARLEVTISELSEDLAKFEKAQAQLKYEEMKVQIDRMRLESPISGKVEQILVKPGESADALAKIIRIVKIDPLWIDAPVPRRLADSVSLGQPASVEFPATGDKPKTTVQGKVIHIAAVGDAASATRTVRVEVGNSSGRAAGDQVLVLFPQAARDSAASRPATADNNQKRKE